MLVPNDVTGTAPISARGEIRLVNEEKHSRLGRILLQRVEAIVVVPGVLGRVVHTDLENVDQHVDVLKSVEWTDTSL
jgi:hypothetical protein